MNDNYSSELRRFVTAEKFKIAYTSFLAQADANVISGKSYGSRTPFGFDGNREFDGAELTQHFGQGRPSNTPYMNWWVLSVYYITSNGKIVLGIEKKGRYAHLNKMNPLTTEKVGNRDVAIFYSTTKKELDFKVLYEKFIEISEKVMHLGLK